jgi:hypothetical protein
MSVRFTQAFFFGAYASLLNAPIEAKNSLFQERPGRLVAEPEPALQLHGRQPGGMNGHEVGGPEPHRQWQPRPMQGRARRQGGLPSARLALPQPPVR